MQFLLRSEQGPIRWATHRNKCMDVSRGETRNGANIQMWDCADDGQHHNMQFILPMRPLAIRWAAHPDKCLDVDGVTTRMGRTFSSGTVLTMASTRTCSSSCQHPKMGAYTGQSTRLSALTCPTGTPTMAQTCRSGLAITWMRTPTCGSSYRLSKGPSGGQRTETSAWMFLMGRPGMAPTSRCGTVLMQVKI